MFTTELFTITKRWKQPKCPSTDEWRNRVWYEHSRGKKNLLETNPGCLRKKCSTFHQKVKLCPDSEFFPKLGPTPFKHGCTCFQTKKGCASKFQGWIWPYLNRLCHLFFCFKFHKGKFPLDQTYNVCTYINNITTFPKYLFLRNLWFKKLLYWND